MIRRKPTAFERAYVEERARGCCEYCKFPFSFSHDAFHVEHVFPLSMGGGWSLDNLAFACDWCNSQKWAFVEWADPETGLKTPLFHPRKDVWVEHFGWNDDFSHIVGKTPKGNATIDLLELNRPGLVNVRKALRAYGVHPSFFDG